MRCIAQVEVEENANSPALPLHVFPMVGERRPLFQLFMPTPQGNDAWHAVTGWSSEGNGTPCQAFCVPVEDSGSSETVLSYLVYGGDWGLRFRRADLDEAWALASAHQFGEPCLLLPHDPVTGWLDRQGIA